MNAGQKHLFEFLKSYIEKNGHSPSYTEIMVGTGKRSKAGIAKLLAVLRDAGHIDYREGVGRSIEIVPPFLDDVSFIFAKLDNGAIAEIQALELIRDRMELERMK